METAAPEAATVAAWPSPAIAAANTRAQRYFFTLSEDYTATKRLSVPLNSIEGDHFTATVARPVAGMPLRNTMTLFSPDGRLPGTVTLIWYSPTLNGASPA